MGKPTNPKTGTGTAVSTVELQFVKNQAIFVTGLVKLQETMKQQTAEFIPTLEKTLAEMSRLKSDFEIQKAELLSTVETTEAKVVEATEKLALIEDEYKTKQTELEAAYNRAFIEKGNEHKQKLIDAENQLRNDITLRGVDAFKKFLGDRSLTTVLVAELKELQEYKIATTEEVNKLVTDAVEAMRKAKDAEKAIAVNAVTATHNNAIAIKDSEINHLNQMIEMLKTEKDKYEKMNAAMTDNTANLIKAAREGASNVNIDAKAGGAK